MSIVGKMSIGIRNAAPPPSRQTRIRTALTVYVCLSTNRTPDMIGLPYLTSATRLRAFRTPPRYTSRVTDRPTIRTTTAHAEWQSEWRQFFRSIRPELAQVDCRRSVARRLPKMPPRFPVRTLESRPGRYGACPLTRPSVTYFSSCPCARRRRGQPAGSAACHACRPWTVGHAGCPDVDVGNEGNRRRAGAGHGFTTVVADPLQGAASVHASAVGAPLQGAWLFESGDCARSWRGGSSIFWSFILFSSVAIVFCVSVSHWPSAKASATGIPSLLDHMYEYAWLSVWQYWMSEGEALATSCWAVAAKGRPNTRLVIKQNFMIFIAVHS